MKARETASPLVTIEPRMLVTPPMSASSQRVSLRPCHLRAGELGAGQVAAGKPRAAQVGLGEVGLLHPAVGEHDVVELAGAERGQVDPAARERHIAKVVVDQGQPGHAARRHLDPGERGVKGTQIGEIAAFEGHIPDQAASQLRLAQVDVAEPARLDLGARGLASRDVQVGEGKQLVDAAVVQIVLGQRCNRELCGKIRWRWLARTALATLAPSIRSAGHRVMLPAAGNPGRPTPRTFCRLLPRVARLLVLGQTCHDTGCPQHKRGAPWAGVSAKHLAGSGMPDGLGSGGQVIRRGWTHRRDWPGNRSGNGGRNRGGLGLGCDV